MRAPPAYVGIDLGTTNSALARFCEGKVELLPNDTGAPLTPSLVYASSDGSLRCGQAAHTDALRDPGNARAEHKRLMGTPNEFYFPAHARAYGPGDLAAVVLRSLAADYRRHSGEPLEAAAISIPAAFELPACEATVRAAEAAGIAKVELVQEPIAAALAAGWQPDDGEGHWLVYDLGGGTFDVSLLEGEEGFLRVVDHAGDPFLGGRDIDAALSRRLLARVHSSPSALEADAWARLRLAAERLKIELGREGTARLELDADAGLPAGLHGLALERAELLSVARPYLDRSIKLVRGLLQTHGLSPRALRGLVLVGGPTRDPSWVTALEGELGIPVIPSENPMTAVARGAACFAAANELRSRSVATPARSSAATALWLRHPAVTADLRPKVVGRCAGPAPWPTRIHATRKDGHAALAEVQTDGSFVLELELLRDRGQEFELACEFDDAARCPADPSCIHIVHGLTIDEPPLGNSVGVALADDRVQVYFERGTPLPARRAFTHRTVEHLAGTDLALRVPIVQGEYDRAHLCRRIGELEVRVEQAAHRIPAGSELEVILELDRSGRLSARAKLPAGLGVREAVTFLLVPAADGQALRSGIDRLRGRAAELKGLAFRERDREALDQLAGYEARIDELASLCDEGRLDPDALGRARHLAVELEAELEGFDDHRRLRELESQALSTLTWANTWVSLRGSPRERQMLEELAVQIDAARGRADAVDLQRQTRGVAQLGESAWLRDPRSWGMLFEKLCADLDRATDLPRARALADRGREALSHEMWGDLRSIVERLRPLLPTRATTQRLAHGSGVR